MVSLLLTAFLLTVVLGGAATAYLWLVHRRRLEMAAGIKIVAGMRWREFSRLVIDALRERGFEAVSLENSIQRSQQADLVLRRDGRTWLLACKQGADYRITPATVSEFSKAMRFNGAVGGLMTTPGRVTADARSHADTVELIDGVALWPMLKPRLPASVRDSVATESDALAVRYVVLAWLAALLLGVGIAWLMPTRSSGDDPASIPVAGKPAAAKSATANTAPLAPAPLSEEEQRAQVQLDVSNLTGIDRALWTSRSTLLIYLDDDSGVDHLQSICTVVERYDALRASRLQLQPVPGSQRAVRFLQCRVF